MSKSKIAIILGTVCLILTILIFIQIKTIKEATQSVGISLSDNSSLRDELLSWKSKYNNIYSMLEKAEKNLESVRIEATSNNEEDTAKETELQKDNILLGLTEVTGEGIIINLDDNRDIKITEVINVSNYLVHEGDLLQIVNELFNAGADAISINDQRVVSTTSILCDGNIVRINGEIVGVPLTIKAIGHPEGLYYALARPQGYLDIMQQDGVIVKATKEQNIVIPKYEGIYSYDYINKGE